MLVEVDDAIKTCILGGSPDSRGKVEWGASLSMSHRLTR